jgi:hypothetical protein
MGHVAGLEVELQSVQKWVRFPTVLSFLHIQFYKLKIYFSLITWQIEDESHLLLNGIKIVIYYTDFSNSDNLCS